MSIFNLQGHAILQPKNVEGNSLQFAFDVNGNQIFRAEPITLKVMSYNVGGWYIGSGTNVPADKDAEYLALQSKIFEDNDVDVLCLQEYMTNFSQLPRTADSVLAAFFTHQNCRQSGTYFGRGICSKTNAVTGYTVNTYTVETSRYYDKAYVTIGGKQIAFFTTHLSVRSAANRAAQVQELLLALRAEEYFVCCGDFNTGIISPSTTAQGYLDAVKPFLDEGFNSANFADFGFMVTCNDGVDGAGTNWYLDNIITSSNITITNAYVDTTKLTDSVSDKIDHMPLIAELKIR